MTIKKLAKSIHKVAKEHGWWNGDITIPGRLCLIHSEVSEALEAYRNRQDLSEELADIVIRVFDLAESEKIDIEKAIMEKHKINEKRSWRHGNKRC